jgi:hypothetical protein
MGASRRKFGVLSIDVSHDEDPVDEETCFLCQLAEEGSGSPDDARDSLAEALAYGVVVLAAGDGLVACDDCTERVNDAIAQARKELREVTRAEAKSVRKRLSR